MTLVILLYFIGHMLLILKSKIILLVLFFMNFGNSLKFIIFFKDSHFFQIIPYIFLCVFILDFLILIKMPRINSNMFRTHSNLYGIFIVIIIKNFMDYLLSYLWMLLNSNLLCLLLIFSFISLCHFKGYFVNSFIILLCLKMLTYLFRVYLNYMYFIKFLSAFINLYIYIYFIAL